MGGAARAFKFHWWVLSLSSALRIHVEHVLQHISNLPQKIVFSFHPTTV